MGLEQLFNSIIPMSALLGFIVVLVIAMRSKSDGKALIETFKKKRFLGIEISQSALALSEGMMAAAISVELFALPYGVRLTGHIALILVSVFSGLQIGDQIKEAKKAIEDGVDVVAECADAIMSVVLTIVPAFANVAYIATSLKGYRDIMYFFTFQHDRIKSGMIMITCWIFIIHVLVVIYLATASTRKERDNQSGGTVDPLTQASDDDSEDADIDDDKAEIITTLPVATTFDPDKVDIENYLVENFQVDRQRLHHRLEVNPTFRREVKNLVTEALTHREEWETAKAILSEATRKIEQNKTRIKRIEDNTYGFDPAVPGRVYTVLRSETEEYEKMSKDTKKEADLAEKNYNLALDAINDELSAI
jgi:hypothetical protein